MAVLPPDPVFVLKGDMECVHSLAYPAYEKDYSRSLLAATESGFVYLWDLESNRVRHKQKMGDSIQAIHSVGGSLITQEKSGALKSWAARESAYELERAATCDGGFCRSLVAGGRVFAPDADGAVAILDLGLTRIGALRPNGGGLGAATCLEWAAFGQQDHILVGYESGDVVLYDGEKERGRLRLGDPVTAIAFDGESRRGVVGTTSDRLLVIGVDRALNVALRAEVRGAGAGCGVVRVRPDRKVLASGGWDGRLRVFSWRTLRALAALPEHRKAVADVQFSPRPVECWGSSVMAAASADGTVSLWNLYN